MEKVKELAFKYALKNALKYGRAEIKPVVSKILASHPEFREKISEIIEICKKAVEEVNSLSETERESLAKEMRIKKEGEKRKKEKILLPELKVEKDLTPVFRIAPNPNGPLHIGHSRMIILNDEYAKRYNGKLVLRFDDTDPKNPAKRPVKEAYEMIRKDLEWLEVKWDAEIIASQRLEIYYSWFEKCLERGIGYICTCDANQWRKLVRGEKKACKCRKRTPEENLIEWKRMLSGEYKEGESVGRIKTSLNEKDPAVIDWVAFRIVDNPKHPLYTENAPKVWPSLDFASAIDDRLMRVTHIIRGKDLSICEKRQRILYEHFKWKYPEVYVFGKIFSEEFVFSTSKMRELMEKGVYCGYDDPRLPTLVSFRKRGIHPKAIRNYIISLGLNESETVLDLKILFAENRKVLDPIAKRFFFVREPVKIKLNEMPLEKVKAPLLPDKRDYREIKVCKEIFIEKEDFEKFKGKEVRLMHFCNIILGEESKVTGLENKDIPKIHWVSKEDCVKTKLIYPEKIVHGVGEGNLENVKKDEFVQFERVGFARCDEKLVFYFAHR